MVSRVPFRRAGRPVRAVLLGVLILLVGLSATGFASVHEVPGGSVVQVDDFGVPEPRVGDRGTYLRLNETTGLPIPAAEDPLAFTFEWLDGGTMVDRAGRMHETHRLALYMAPPSDWEADPTRSMHARLDLDRGDHSLVASTFVSRDPSQGVGVAGTGQLSAAWTSFHVRPAAPGVQHPAIPGVPCGLSNGLQGAAAPTHLPMLSPPCSQPELNGPRVRHMGGHYTFDGAFLWNGTTFADYRLDLRATFEGASHGLYPPSWMRFDQDVPYPVLFDMEVLGDEGFGDARFVLAAFTRGHTALPEETRRPWSLPSLERAPAPAWGIDDAGIEHPFPLREAWKEAMADPRFADEVAFFERPDVGLSHVWFTEEEDDGRARLQWHIQATDGTDVAVLCPMRVYAAPNGERMPVAIPGVRDPMQDDTQLVRCDPPLPERRTMAVGERPTVQSMRDIWDAVAPSLSLEEVVPLAYGFAVQGHPDDPAELEFVIGAQTRAAPLVPILTSAAAPAGREQAITRLRFDPEGNITGISISHYSDTFTGPVALPSDGEGPAAPTQATTSSYVFQVPSVRAAGALTAVALLVALLYALWPALKALPLPLFSRIDRPRVLDHEVRARIAEAVGAEPGIHAEELRRRVDVAPGAMQHHLRKLVETGVLGRRKVGNRACYYLQGEVDVHQVDEEGALRGDTARRVLAAWRARPDASLAELAEALGVARQTVHYHQKRLRSAGLAPL